jgi:hypothetical protein
MLQALKYQTRPTYFEEGTTMNKNLWKKKLTKKLSH